MKTTLVNVTLEWDEKRQLFKADAVWHDGGARTQCHDAVGVEALRRVWNGFLTQNRTQLCEVSEPLQGKPSPTVRVLSKLLHPPTEIQP